MPSSGAARSGGASASLLRCPRHTKPKTPPRRRSAAQTTHCSKQEKRMRPLATDRNERSRDVRLSARWLAAQSAGVQRIDRVRLIVSPEWNDRGAGTPTHETRQKVRVRQDPTGPQQPEGPVGARMGSIPVIRHQADDRPRQQAIQVSPDLEHCFLLRCYSNRSRREGLLDAPHGFREAATQNPTFPPGTKVDRATMIPCGVVTSRSKSCWRRSVNNLKV